MGKLPENSDASSRIGSSKLRLATQAVVVRKRARSGGSEQETGLGHPG